MAGQLTGAREAWAVAVRAGVWLALAASPAFAFMAWRAANVASAAAVCSPGSRVLSIDGMTGMYVLMSIFHLPPWLKLAFGYRRAADR